MSVSLFLIYVVCLGNILTSLIFPGGLSGFDYKSVDATGKLPTLYTPLWKENESLDVAFYLSTSPSSLPGDTLHKVLKPPQDIQGKGQGKHYSFLFASQDIKHSSDTEPVVFKTNLSSSRISPYLWKKAIKGKTYLHGVVYKSGTTTFDSFFTTKKNVFFMGKRKDYSPPKPKFRLFEKTRNVCGDPKLLVFPSVSDYVFAAGSETFHPVKKPHWTPSVSFKVVADFTDYPANQIPPLIGQVMQLVPDRRQYLPFTYVDSVGMTSKKYITLNNSVEELPLEIKFEPNAAIGRWLLGQHMEQSMKLMETNLGAQDKDVDDIREMLTETHPYLLVVTLCVTLLHSLFDVLAMKSDIEFWKNLKSKRGLSTRSQVTSLFCQIVIVAYLQHEKGSMLILVPSAFGIILQTWKVYKLLFSSLGIVQTDGELSASDKEELAAIQRTKHFDDMAGKYLGRYLYPVVFAIIFHSAFCSGHETYYGWFISSAVYVVYTFGFIIMTPQLFINYKLKSVAQLPWKFFMYKALNTFIDDLFAFIIQMPTAHRLSCFRDDIVFFIFLYQRWIYPVDKKRFAIGVESTSPDESKKGKSPAKGPSVKNNSDASNVLANRKKKKVAKTEKAAEGDVKATASAPLETKKNM